MNIAVASGKGGTGKTTISVSLAEFLVQKGQNVSLYDCDVEEPNANLFLKIHSEETRDSSVLIPQIDFDACTGCGKCEKICNFSAIVMVKQKPLFLPEMCHSCGGCTLVCTEGAIKEVRRNIGVVEQGEKNNLRYAGGRLNISEHMSPPLIKDVIRYIISSRINIFDIPPGTSCPPVTAIYQADYVILVTEPTPFGLHDLQLACEMTDALGKPYGVVINRAGGSFTGIEDFCTDKNIPVLTSIPHERDVAVDYSRGDFIAGFVEKFSAQLNEIAEKTGVPSREGAV